MSILLRQDTTVVEKNSYTCQLETSTCDGELNEVPCRGLESTPVNLSSQGVGS